MTPLAPIADLDETAQDTGLAAGATIVAVSVYNPSNASAHVKLFDVAENPAVASTEATVVLGLASGATHVFALPGGWALTAGCFVAATTQAGAGAGAPSADLVCQIWTG